MTLEDFLEPLRQDPRLPQGLLEYLVDTYDGGSAVAPFVEWVVSGDGYDGQAETDDEYEARRALRAAVLARAEACGIDTKKK